MTTEQRGAVEEIKRIAGDRTVTVEGAWREGGPIVVGVAAPRLGDPSVVAIIGPRGGMKVRVHLFLTRGEFSRSGRRAWPALRAYARGRA